jgi:dTDP-4-dehydrorhamnose reductase
MLVLVTGAGGLLGSNLTAAAVQQSWSVLGAWRRDPVEIAGARMVALDVADRAACVAAAVGFEPDVIVHAASAGAPGPFEREPRLSQLERLGVENTLAAARAVRARYVLVSCDWVFSGLRPADRRWTEGDEPEPVNEYGRAKLVAEELVREASVSWLITRVADVYGVNMSTPPAATPPAAGPPAGARRLRVVPPAGADADAGGERGERLARHVWGASGSALRLVGRLREGQTLPAPADVHRSPTYAWDYAQRVCELIAQRSEGVLHTAGPDAMDRREYLRLLARAFGCEEKLVREGSLTAYLEACGEDPGLPLPPNTALDGERVTAALGHPALDVATGLAQMREQLLRVLGL